MPREGNNQSPPPTMTWARALPVIIVAGVFDALRMFFTMFWFFGPALLAVGCTVGGNSYFNTTVASFGGKLIAAGCTATAGVLGFFGVEVTETFGIIMAAAVGLLGFLVLALWVLVTNARLFKANRSGVLWLVGSFGLSEIPFIGTLPAFSVTLFMLYRRQIKVERAARKRWEKEQAEMLSRERERQVAQLMQMQTARLEEEEAANEGLDAEEAQDGEIPEVLPRAA